MSIHMEEYIYKKKTKHKEKYTKKNTQRKKYK